MPKPKTTLLTLLALLLVSAPASAKLYISTAEHAVTKWGRHEVHTGWARRYDVPKCSRLTESKVGCRMWVYGLRNTVSQRHGTITKLNFRFRVIDVESCVDLYVWDLNERIYCWLYKKGQTG